jgi:DNA polymerase III epsilon subunit family exonuclease
MQLRLDAADRLVELVEERAIPVEAEEAGRALFATGRIPVGLARSLLDEVVRTDARLRWIGSSVAVVDASGADVAIDAATFVVVDLETTGLSPGRAGICEIGAVRVRGLVAAARFQTLVDPGVALPAPVAALTGLEERELRGAPSPATAVRRFLDFAGIDISPAHRRLVGATSCVLVAHNARFDVGFLNREVGRLTGLRLAVPVLDTVRLARALLGGRVPRASLAALAHFFGTSVEPCHRALPDAAATAEVLVALIGLAQERGATTVGDLAALAAPRPRRVHAKRSLARGAPARPGVYLFHGVDGQVLYVGRARDLRARLRSYFSSERQRPAVEAALLALERVEWRVLGSELEAALEELRLIRDLRPPANARGARPDRYVYLRRRGDSFVVSSSPSELGPIKSRRQAELAARALRGADVGRPEAALPDLRRRLRALAECLRYEDAARLRDRIRALERVCAALAELERVRRLECCVLAPALEPGFKRAFFVARGRIGAVRTVPLGAGARVELDTGLRLAREERAPGPTEADELLVLGSFLRRPPPEMAVLPLCPERLAAACAGEKRRPVA